MVWDLMPYRPANYMLVSDWRVFMEARVCRLLTDVGEALDSIVTSRCRPRRLRYIDARVADGGLEIEDYWPSGGGLEGDMGEGAHSFVRFLTFCLFENNQDCGVVLRTSSRVYGGTMEV